MKYYGKVTMTVVSEQFLIRYPSVFAMMVAVGSRNSFSRRVPIVFAMVVAVDFRNGFAYFVQVMSRRSRWPKVHFDVRDEIRGVMKIIHPSLRSQFGIS